MREFLLFAVLAVLYSCSSSSYGPANKYIGRIPTIRVEEAKAYQEYLRKIEEKNKKEDWNETYGIKFKELMDKEFANLNGTTMPCISGDPDVFTVLGDVAVFFDGMYHVLLEFEDDVIFNGDPTFYVNFCNSDEQKAYGQITQIMFRRNVTRFGRNVKLDVYEMADNRIQSFAINEIITNDYEALQQKTNLAVIFLKEGGYLVKEGLESEYLYPEFSAVYFQECCFEAASEKDLEAFLDADGSYANEKYKTESEQTYFNQAYNLWKIAYPEEWKTIKEFRKKLIAEGQALTVTDVADPAF